MRNPHIISHKIFTLRLLLQEICRWRVLSNTIVFTNGCFDILHAGHVYSLSQAASEGDFLIVGVNSDQSVRKIKGEQRPVNDQVSRATLLASLLMVDAVVIFDEDSPLPLIQSIRPDVMVKGGDWRPDQVIGAKEVIEYGGKVVINPLLNGFSTTKIIAKIHAL